MYPLSLSIQHYVLKKKTKKTQQLIESNSCCPNSLGSVVIPEHGQTATGHILQKEKSKKGPTNLIDGPYVLSKGRDFLLVHLTSPHWEFGLASNCAGCVLSQLLETNATSLCVWEHRFLVTVYCPWLSQSFCRHHHAPSAMTHEP